MNDKGTSITGTGQSSAHVSSNAIAARKRGQRSQRVMAKAALRRRPAKVPGGLSFARLAENTVYRRLAVKLCPEQLAKKITPLGFDTPAALAACRTVGTLEARLPETVNRTSLSAEELRHLLSQARREALRIHRLMRHGVAVQEPMNQALRYTPSALSGEADRLASAQDVPAFAKPGSLQSNQSPGAYLRYLYRIATGLDTEIGIKCAPDDSPYAIANRRPDLADLVLNEANLKKEVPTLDLVNEVLSAGLSEIDVGTSFYPIALPYDHATTTCRAALAQIGGTRVNDVATGTCSLGFGAVPDHVWARDTAGLLGVLGARDPSGSSVLALLSEDSAEPSVTPLTLEDLYNNVTREDASTVDRLMSSLDLDFDGLAQILGLYNVSQERGGRVEQRAFATAFLANEADIELSLSGEEEAPQSRLVKISGAPLPVPDLRALNYLARLHHGTGLAFHDLNTILGVPGAADSVVAAPDDPSHTSRRVTSAGLRLLASYPLYRDTFGLTPAGFAALFGEVSPYWRSDEIVEGEGAVAGLEQTEVSFLRTLFKGDAPDVHTVVSAAKKTPITDGELSSIVARGLGLSALELDRLISALDASFELTEGLDARGLGALYRLTTLCGMLGWPLVSGLELIQRVSSQLGDANKLWTQLVSRNESETDTVSLCAALDWIVALSQWMVEADLSPDSLLDLLTPVPSGSAMASDGDIAWIEGIATAFNPWAVGEDVFQDFETWPDGQAGNTEIPAKTWHDRLLHTDPVYRQSGVFLPGSDRDAIEAACRGCLVAAGVDPDQEGSAAQLQSLVLRLDGLAAGQRDLIAAEIAALDPAVNVAGAAPLILWAQTTPLDLLDVFLNGHADQTSLFWLAEIKRHIAVVTALGLGDVDLWILAHRAEWLAQDAVSRSTGKNPLTLAQLYWLQRFAAVQVGAATDAAWRGYLVLTNESRPDAERDDTILKDWIAGCRETLALLIGCPPEDAALYLDALYGEKSVAATIAQIDAIARHARMADDLGVSARELLALKAVSDPDVSGDWEAAAAAAQAGLSRFDGGRHVPGFRAVLSEHHRNALVAAYLQSKVANDETLKADVTDREKLYAYLLLDVNVSSAVPTSRIVEAINSLQLFISRALSGLEPDVSFHDRDTLAAQWELDKDYRQWEANQKLELYPQNYIEPELRQITSPEFDALHQAVSGGDVSPDSVEAAVNAYMNALAGLCDLSVCSFYAEQHSAVNEPDTYHVLAKAKWEPGRFFYRQLKADYQSILELEDSNQSSEDSREPAPFLKAMDWTYWQEVSIPRTFDLFSDVAVCVFKNRFFFFWLELEERQTQNPDGSTTPIWRLHPRYMRCDQNALTGAMLTPGLFIDGVLGEGQNPDALTIDRAFQWTGEKPFIYATYQPTLAPAGLVNGKLGASTDREGSSTDTLTVTFGVGLAATPNAEQPNKAALHIRLSEEWSDAILDLEDQLNTIFEDNAPDGFTSIHPRPLVETNAVADPDQGKVYFYPTPLADLDGTYEYPNARVSSTYDPEETTASITFTPAPRGDGSLGSFEIELDLGQRRYDLTGLNGRTLKTIEEIEPEKAQVRYGLEISGDRRHEAHWSPLRTLTRLTKTNVSTDSWGDNGESFSTVDHETKEPFSNTVRLPDDWVFESAGSELTVKITATVKREFPRLRVVTSTGGGTKSAKPASVEHTVDIGAFTLLPPEGKNNSAWAQTGEHGSRNFLHLTDNRCRKTDEMFVLSNFSTVLSELAKTMPRPGGCESLFALENQSGQENFGTFFDDFAVTLDEIYGAEAEVENEAEDTERVPGRLPAQDFDFDSAYGAYGWEVFYHIPAAIAAGYASSGQFDEAQRWLQKIFDPHANLPWQVKPLIDARAPTGNLAFDTGDVIVDPDRIARDYPFYYQQATIRTYLETLIEAGDAAYEQETQESLQRAKALFVAAKQLFSDNLSETLESLTNTPWTNPTLGEAADTADKDTADKDYDVFLPPYNQELRGIYATVERRLHTLRHWQNVNGEPLDVPLLAPPIDPRQLQRIAKAKLTLRSGDENDEDATTALLDFPYIVKSAKGYLNNLKLTSHRLQDANEKEGDAIMDEFQMDAAIRQSARAVRLHDFSIEAARKEAEIKEINVVTMLTVLANHTAQALAKVHDAMQDTAEAAIDRLKASSKTIENVVTQVSGMTKANIPTTYGFSNGGQNLEQGEAIKGIVGISQFLFTWNAVEKAKAAELGWADSFELVSKTFELTSQLSAAARELQKAKIELDAEKAMLAELQLQNDSAQQLRNAYDNSFGGTSFYKPFREDLETLYADEWAATQDLCRLLVKRYDQETGQTNGSRFLRTKRLGTGVQKFSAPHRLALDIERLETAYIQTMVDQACQTCECEFALSEITAMGQNHSALEELATFGQTSFELTEEMFDLYYPGQYDRRIQSIAVSFPGLARAGLKPHARLTQISNTRYLAPDRRRSGSAAIRKDRHGLQSLVLSGCEVDSRNLEAPDGLLRRFQNTGVESRWQLAMPSVQELKRNKGGRSADRRWRNAAEERIATLQEHLGDVMFTIRFSGRWGH